VSDGRTDRTGAERTIDVGRADGRSSSKRIARRRRPILTSGGTGLAVALAGCLDGDGSDDSGDGGSAAGNGSGSATAAPAASEGGSTGSEAADTATAGSGSDSTASTSGSPGDLNLDLREANVVGVEVERSGSEYTFDVTLHHDDESESGYANWWQVETTGGERLGRRELLHAHGSERFTRSDTIDVPEDVSRVVVRGHDEVHGYGGRVIVVTLASGETRAVSQGSEPQAFGDESGSKLRSAVR
jgi:hypothetical protein